MSRLHVNIVSKILKAPINVRKGGSADALREGIGRHISSRRSLLPIVTILKPDFQSSVSGSERMVRVDDNILSKEEGLSILENISSSRKDKNIERPTITLEEVLRDAGIEVNLEAREESILKKIIVAFHKNFDPVVRQDLFGSLDFPCDAEFYKIILNLLLLPKVKRLPRGEKMSVNLLKKMFELYDDPNDRLGVALVIAKLNPKFFKQEILPILAGTQKPRDVV